MCEILIIVALSNNYLSTRAYTQTETQTHTYISISIYLYQNIFISTCLRTRELIFTPCNMQDNAFILTDPEPTCLGFWFALDDATIENGCLWALPGSHKEYPVNKRFVRTGDENRVGFKPGRFNYS